MTDLNQNTDHDASSVEPPFRYDSSEKIDSFLTEIESKMAESNDSTTYVMLAMNHMLRDSQFPKFLDATSKQRIATIWDKISLSGFELNKPPIIFGVPESTGEVKSALDGNLDDGTEIISITLPPDKEETKPKKEAKPKVEEEDDYDDDDSEMSSEDDDEA